MAKTGSPGKSADWNPAAYARFRSLRLRPALDLLAQVGDLPKGQIIDLGCGNGAVGPALSMRWPDRKLIGVDNSPAMLAEAAATGAYRRCDLADLTEWQPKKPPALIFSNAVLHWLGDHATLLPRLAGWLAPGGTLAVQMPRQYGAPSHRFLREFAQEMFPDRFDFAGWEPPVAGAAEYARMLAPLGRVNAWSTDYIQRLDPVDGAHPVRRFTESTALRPFVEKLNAEEQAAFIARYEIALAAAYPPEADGSVLFPFRRVFFTVTVP
ncbi:methyltransferase domain-containing protein [Paenirhodobacter sp. CAU 1674]|uniref:methyltransferase domain-containing protein n=1 Tax=Paenirhodobacter sp. CAU 1674 TaxID=3032596 RepID=UPI0023DADD94|nr:methyltransferase domain-containing protein [Paenirhodobacter sp. CAU 1674]MDF2140682.1 methyltransferase domain-containing protein [Paenirhodobacter sp. CAU 1674]